MPVIARAGQLVLVGGVSGSFTHSKQGAGNSITKACHKATVSGEVT